MQFVRKHIYIALMLVMTGMLVTAAVILPHRYQAVAAEKEGAADRNWTIAAPGLVEPKDGEIRLGVEIVGRVVAIPVSVREKVKAGQVLLRLDDADAITRIQSALAEVEIRERNRDNVGATRRGRNRRRAADKLAETEVALFKARRDLDHLDEKDNGAKPTSAEIDAALDKISKAEENHRAAQTKLEEINALEETPLYSRSESALELARANYTLALQAFEKTRIRAAADGTVLRINARKGEVVSPAMRLPLIIVGDISRLRVRAEVDERSIADVKNGQRAIIRSVAFDGTDFNGSVSEISASLGPGRITKRQQQGPSNANVLEVMLDVDGDTPLLSGMEVDVLFVGADEERSSATTSSKPEKPAATN